MSEKPPSTYRPDPTMLRLSTAHSRDSDVQGQPMLSRSSSARNWAYTSQNNPPPTEHLRPHTSPPVASTSRQALPGTYSEEDEYMNIRASGIDFGDGEINCGNSDTADGKKRGIPFVGGFVSGLKRLPRVVRGPRHATRPRRDAEATEATEATITEFAPPPRYQTQNNEQLPMDPTNILYVQGSEMPDHTSYTPDPRASYAHDTEAAFTIPPDPNSEHLPQHITSPPNTTSIILGNEDRQQLPLHMDPHRAPDYAKMGGYSSHRTDSISGTSFSHGLPAILNFFRNLYEMPWVAEHNIVDDYRPGQNLPDKGRKKASVAPVSWYTAAPSRSRHQSVDLTRSLESSIMPSPRPAAPVIPRRHHHGQSRSRHHHHHHGHQNTQRSSGSRDYGYPNRNRGSTQRRTSWRRYSGPGGSHASRTSPRGSASTGVMYSPTMPAQPFYVMPGQPPAIYAPGSPQHGLAPGEPGNSPQGTPQGQLTPPYYVVPVLPYPTHGRREGSKYPMHSTPAPSAVSGGHAP
jgi:hypothetical protein